MERHWLESCATCVSLLGGCGLILKMLFWPEITMRGWLFAACKLTPNAENVSTACPIYRTAMSGGIFLADRGWAVFAGCKTRMSRRGVWPVVPLLMRTCQSQAQLGVCLAAMWPDTSPAPRLQRVYFIRTCPLPRSGAGWRNKLRASTHGVQTQPGGLS